MKRTWIIGVLLSLVIACRGSTDNSRTPVAMVTDSADTATAGKLSNRSAGVKENTKDNDIALIYAARNGRTVVVKALLDKGADVNTKNVNGQTSLMYASSEGHLSIAKILLDNGADINAKDGLHGTTALMKAAAKGQFRVVGTLLDKGAAVNIKDNNGRTALIWAMDEGYSPIVKLLRKFGATE